MLPRLMSSLRRTQLVNSHLTKSTTSSTFARRMSSSSEPAITLYTAQTPNGVKISIFLEELGIPYKVHPISFEKTEQKEPWFLEINPNGRIPAITDKSFNNGEGIHVFESGAILQYLADTYDKEHKFSYPHGTREYYEVIQWVFFQNAGVGPMQGQANHFLRYAPEKIQYGIDRYQNETKRLYGVLNDRLKKNPEHGWLVGDRPTIADFTTYGWVRSGLWAGVDVAEFPELQKWQKQLEAREGVQKGDAVPVKHKLAERLQDKEAAEREAEKARQWILNSNKK